jgi:hypothetical protein
VRLYEQIDFLVALKGDAEQDLIRESRKHSIARVLETTPGLGPIRVARLLPIVVTPHRFRTRQQFWSYCGLGIVMRSNSDWVRTPDKRWIRAQVQQTRGLTRQHNHARRERSRPPGGGARGPSPPRAWRARRREGQQLRRSNSEEKEATQKREW